MSSLFQPGKIAQLEVPNRLVRSATCEWSCDADGRAGKRLVEMYAELARGGVGLVVTGHAYVMRAGRASPGQIGLYSDDLAEALRPVAEAAHQGGAKVVVQINHAGGAARPELNDGAEPWAPSSVPMGPDRPMAHAMSDAEIREMVRAYGLAARRSKAVGFDGVQLHGAHGYLISQFISPFTNQRSDRWGGSFDNRLNFLRAVCDEVRGQIGADFPLMIKLASQDFVDGGLTPQDGARIAGRLADFGLDAVEVSGGVQVGRNQANNVRLNVKEWVDEAYFLDNARRIRDATDLPVMIVGGFRTPELMQRMIENEGMDFVALCRPLVHDPDFPNRMAAGSDERSGCISCNLCLTNRHEPLRCWYKYPDRSQE